MASYFGFSFCIDDLQNWCVILQNNSYYTYLTIFCVNYLFVNEHAFVITIFSLIYLFKIFPSRLLRKDKPVKTRRDIDQKEWSEIESDLKVRVLL